MITQTIEFSAASVNIPPYHPEFTQSDLMNNVELYALLLHTFFACIALFILYYLLTIFVGYLARLLRKENLYARKYALKNPTETPFTLHVVNCKECLTSDNAFCEVGNRLARQSLKDGF